MPTSTNLTLLPTKMMVPKSLGPAADQWEQSGLTPGSAHCYQLPHGTSAAPGLNGSKTWAASSTNTFQVFQPSSLVENKGFCSSLIEGRSPGGAHPAHTSLGSQNTHGEHPLCMGCALWYLDGEGRAELKQQRHLGS